MRIFLIISFICSLAWALTTTPGWNGGNVVLNSITGTTGALPVATVGANPVNVLPNGVQSWAFDATGSLNASIINKGISLHGGASVVGASGSTVIDSVSSTDTVFKNNGTPSMKVGALSLMFKHAAHGDRTIISAEGPNPGEEGASIDLRTINSTDVSSPPGGIRIIAGNSTPAGGAANVEPGSIKLQSGTYTGTGLGVSGGNLDLFAGSVLVGNALGGEIKIASGLSSGGDAFGGATKFFNGGTGGIQWLRSDPSAQQILFPAVSLPVLFSGNITKINNVATSWPASQGAANTFLQNNGSGVFSWATAGSVIGNTVSGGTANRVLYEDASNNLAESANLTFNGSTLTALAVSSPTITATDSLTVNGAGGLLVSRSGGLGDAVALFRVTPFGAADDAKITVSMTDGSFNFTNRNDVAKTVMQTRDVSSVINDTLTLNGTNYMMKLNGADLNSSIQLYTNSSGSTATDGMLMDFDGTNMTFNNQEGQTFNIASSFGFTGSELDLIDGNFLTTATTDITLGYTFNNSTIGVSSSVQQIATTGALELQNNGGAGINFIAPAVRIAGGRTESTFQRSCTLTSAASATPINCLDTLDIGTGQAAYISGFRAKVNGAVGWTGVVTCSIEDTAAVSYVDIPVANLTASAYINDSTVGAVLNDPFALGTGGTADNGIEIVCNSNGTTGSDLVVTVYGVIK